MTKFKCWLMKKTKVHDIVCGCWWWDNSKYKNRIGGTIIGYE